MKAYKLLPNRVEWSKLNSIEGTHAVKLPGIICPKCGTWAMTGIIYPSANVEVIIKESIVQSFQPIALPDFNNLTMRLRPLIGTGFPIHPGMELGSLCEKAKGS